MKEGEMTGSVCFRLGVGVSGSVTERRLQVPSWVSDLHTFVTIHHLNTRRSAEILRKSHLHADGAQLLIRDTSRSHQKKRGLRLFCPHFAPRINESTETRLTCQFTTAAGWLDTFWHGGVLGAPRTSVIINRSRVRGRKTNIHGLKFCFCFF